MGRGFWEHWHPALSSFLVGMDCFFLLLLLEPALWSATWLSGLGVRIPDPVAASLLLVLPWNAWFLDRFVSAKTPRDASLPRWLRALRLVTLSPPVLCLYTLSLWREVLVRRERKGAAPPPPTVTLNLTGTRRCLPAGLRTRFLYRSGFFFLWIVSGLVPALAWTLWLATTPSLGPRRQPLILGACALLHLIVTTSMVRFLGFERRRLPGRGWRATVLLLAPYLQLLALPGLLVGFALYLTAKPSDSSLTWTIHARRTSVGRIPLWHELQGRLRERWLERPWFAQWRRPRDLLRSTDAGRREKELTAFYRLKTLLLLLESVALTNFLGPSFSLIGPALGGAVALALTGALLHAVALLARLLKLRRASGTLKRHPYGRYLLLTQTAFLAGAYTGAALPQLSVEQFGTLLCLAAALAAVTSTFFLFPGAGLAWEWDMLLWGLLYLAISALGGLLALEGEAWRPGLRTFLGVLAAVSPVLSVGLFWVAGDWLLRPFGWRQIFARVVPPGFRIALALTALTAVLPFGGLAIPFWIFVRHRLWPRYEERQS